MTFAAVSIADRASARSAASFTELSPLRRLAQGRQDFGSSDESGRTKAL